VNIARRSTHPTSLHSSALSSASGKEGGESFIVFLFSSPSFLLAKERVGQRSASGLSKLCALHERLCPPGFTHPTSLHSSALSSASGKEGGGSFIVFYFFSPSFLLAKERVGQRSASGVSPPGGHSRPPHR